MWALSTEYLDIEYTDYEKEYNPPKFFCCGRNAYRYQPAAHYEESQYKQHYTYHNQCSHELGIDNAITMNGLEAFNGSQPSYYLNEVAIRHWDGHWFGKRELFGDTFPHYWSTITGAVYYYYALCTGDSSYQKRAENVVRNNLCLFFEDGKASCAYMCSLRVDTIRSVPEEPIKQF